MATNGNSPEFVAKASFAAFKSPKNAHARMGLLDFGTGQITAIAYKSGAPVSSLYEIIEAGEDAFQATDDVSQLSDVKLLAPISGRDVLAVGKNYAEHAKEFNESGYDSSDKVDQPTYPVIFTKRATSIIGHGDEIYPHPGFTESVDYEGEIGVIIGKPGFKISEENAMDHVWGYTIINDYTARERQRDHKQFFIGKSPDTFCPIGPVAVPKEHLPKQLTVQTFVNGEKRQEATTDQLIFSIPFLVKTLSEGQTLQVGDVLATGTPAGVGFGFRPMKFLAPGDVVSVKVTGLGTLTNRIGSLKAVNQTVERVTSTSYIPYANTKALDVQESGLKPVGNKKLFYRQLGEAQTTSSHITFVHGLGGSFDYFTGLFPHLQKRNALHLMDLEGHGLSPTSASSMVSIASYAKDITDILASEGVTKTAVVAHSMGCLIAVKLALENPQLVSKLVLMGPPPSPLPEAAATGTYARAKLVRQRGMMEVADTLAAGAVSEHTKADNPLAITALRLSVTSQHPEGYAKACGALASAPEMKFSDIGCSTFILTGAEDKISPPALCEKYGGQISNSKVEILENVGHWHLFENTTQVIKSVTSFL